MNRNMFVNDVPQDVQWNDIDYMDAHKDFTIDPRKYSSLVSDVVEWKKRGQRYIMIIDPAISTDVNYSTFVNGMQADVFVRNSSGLLSLTHPKTPWFLVD